MTKCVKASVGEQSGNFTILYWYAATLTPDNTNIQPQYSHSMITISYSYVPQPCCVCSLNNYEWVFVTFMVLFLSDSRGKETEY